MLEDINYMEKIVDKSKGVKTNVNSNKIQADGEKMEKKKISDLLAEFAREEERENSIVVNDEEPIVKRFSV